jgi:hypothetical protein
LTKERPPDRRLAPANVKSAHAAAPPFEIAWLASTASLRAVVHPRGVEANASADANAAADAKIPRV